jgi:hypothetical protein
MNPGASGRLEMVFGRSIDAITTEDVGGTKMYEVGGVQGDGVIVSIGGRSGVPHALAELVDTAYKADTDSVHGEFLYDHSGQFLGYRMTVNGRAIDITGAASRFYPGKPFFRDEVGRLFDHPTDVLDSHAVTTPDRRYAASVDRIRTPAQSASIRDAPPESGNFDGGYVSSAVQVSHYAAYMRAVYRMGVR